MTNDTDLASPLLLDAPQRSRRLEADTAAAIAASVVGALCVIACAVGLIREFLQPLGTGPVLVAGVLTGIVTTMLLAGGVWAWLHDRSGGAS